MKNRKLCFVFVLLLLYGIVTNSVFATKVFSSHKLTHIRTQIVAGASLKEYKPINNADCDIRIPKQYTTIQAGIDAAVIGNTVCVTKGIYNENIIISKSIRLSGRGAKNKSIINGQTAGYVGAVRIQANNVIVEGFIIKGAGTDYGNAALRIGESVSGAMVRYNHIIAGNGELALLTDGFQNNHIIQNNILEGNNSPQVALVNGQPSVSKPSNNVNFLNNTFTGTVNPTSRGDTGVVLAMQATDSKVEYNVFNTSGTVNEVVANAYASALTSVNYNNFNSVAQLWKVSNSVGILNAENNWWGDTDPSNDVRNDMVDFAPFATSPFAEN